ncbi:MAG: hypothetical protein RMK91_06915 [Pseudanabaenaceae cyanobacterium SKYGB_i_bin29]|nr:hypothetical protein [Pseudanabaenaceae cyanobacterium SKYG29]MDW8421583.1 hypothetical protein [Pseudanabaenaceae cyanobacterium SKYGB_i_bin29]
MKFVWVYSGLTFPTDKAAITKRLNDRFSPLSGIAHQYRLEAKYMLTGVPRPPIALYHPQWTDREALRAVSHKLAREYDCPVFLIGAAGKGVTTPERSLFLQQAAALLTEWDRDGHFTVKADRIAQTLQLWRRLANQYRSSHSPLHLMIEATLCHSALTARDWYDFYQLVYPFLTERPIFCLTAVPPPFGKDFRVKGTTFVWRSYKEEEEKLQPGHHLNLAFYVAQKNKSKWEGVVLDVTPTL